jgi:glycosyltransferase involved in cell wall biosynthesis
MLVSVIIPTYNRSKLVTDAVQSALSQTYKDFEIIVIDDGSTDNTQEMLEKFSNDIQYIKTNRIGPGKARNLGISKSKGEYVAFLDSDDLWMDFKLELQVNVLNKFPEIGFLCTNFSIFFDTGKQIHNGLSTWIMNNTPWEYIYEKKFSFKSLDISLEKNIQDFDVYMGNLYLPLLYDVSVMPSSSIVRKSFLDDTIKFKEEVFVYEDWEFFTLLSRKTDNLFLNIETTLNRGHDDEVRLTKQPVTYKHQKRLEMIDRIWLKDTQFIESYEPDLLKVKNGLLASLTKSLIFENKTREAIATYTQFKKIRTKEFRFYYLLLFLLINIPFMAQIARTFRLLFHKLK